MDAMTDMSKASHPIPGRFTSQDACRVALLAIIVMFEGFDVSVTSVVVPYVAGPMKVGAAQVGKALSIIGLGSILAAFIIRLADRIGRKPVLLLSSAAFAAGTVATAFASDLTYYTIVQFFTRMMAVTQVAMAYLIISESLPPAVRGRANGLMGAFGSLGAALPFILLEVGLSTSLGWRSLFLLGGAPLLFLPFLLVWLKETPVFLARRREGVIGPSWIAQIKLITAPNIRQRLITMSSFWFLLNMASMSATVFFTTYVVQERAWPPSYIAILGLPILIAAFAGNLITGAMMDRFGRRATLTILLLSIGLLSQIGYSAQDRWVISICWIGIQCSYGVWSAAFTFNAELFPTELRATANGICNNLIGRWGMVLAPLLISNVAGTTGGIGHSVFWFSFAAYLAVPLIWFALPETKNTDLQAAH